MGTIAAGLEGVIAGESEICFIDGYQGILSYRGYNIHTLAEHATFEEVIFLLWNGWLPKQDELERLKKDLVAERGLPAPVAEFLKGVPKSNAMDMLRTAVSMLSLYDSEAQDMSPEANHRKAARLMAKTATIVTSFERLRTGKDVVAGDPNLGFAANFLYTLSGNKPDEVMERAFDVALILHADHELNASTFAARVTAATLSDIYSCVTSGIGALKGPLHGGANQDVIKWLLDLGDEHEAEQRVKDKLAAKIKIPGFGHRVYRTEDPRATHLRVLSEELGKAHRSREAISPLAYHGKYRDGRKAYQPQRGFLLGLHLLFTQYPRGSVHAHLCGESHVGMDRPCARAISQQPPDPSPRRVQGQA